MYAEGVISIRLISTFFLDTTTAVAASSTAIMEFEGVGRKLVKFTSHGALGKNAIVTDGIAGESKVAS